MAKILIVDDSGFMRAMLRNILKKAGYKDFIEASTGKQAMGVFKKQKPALVLLDIIMPDVGGDEILNEMVKSNPKSKIVMVTAVGQKPMMDRCIKIGAKNYIVKPFEEKVLIKIIKDILKG